MSNLDSFPLPSPRGGHMALRPDIVQVHLIAVNAYLVGQPGEDWILVDTGISGNAKLLQQAAKAVHGLRPPAAIVLTHGHPDHIGNVEALQKVWGGVPVYAHSLELPYLTGRSGYPLAPLKGKVKAPAADFRPHIHPLPEDGTVPFAPGWRWLHTPGHSDGHISLWREADRSLIAGDIFGSFDLHKPASWLTGLPALASHAMFYVSRQQAQRSVGLLADLHPELAAVGHGRALEGPGLGADLRRHQRSFDAQLAASKKTKGLPRPVKAGAALLGLGALLGYAMWQERE